MVCKTPLGKSLDGGAQQNGGGRARGKAVTKNFSASAILRGAAKTGKGKFNDARGALKGTRAPFPMIVAAVDWERGENRRRRQKVEKLPIMRQ